MSHRTKKRRGSRRPAASCLLTWLLLLALQGCSTGPDRYVEKYEVKGLTIVFLDETSLKERWKQVTGLEAVNFKVQMNSTLPVVRTVQGFFDYTSNTLYCPKWNFKVCGHELHHAVLGQFHSAE